MPLEFSSSDDAPSREHVFGVLTDDDCRAIIATLEEPRTVAETAEEIDRPLSTTYRKLDRLTEAGLVRETVGVGRSRSRKSRYVADFDRVAIGLDDDRSLRVDVENSSDPLVGLWTQDS
ncbi:helix-turn-helix domain-containing protein [Natronococcus sp. A-GB1]|uniref:winged helix-turn-helix domain-containing protein n=1 Tax=Natronococcus sp. A-GB1 TaxID=3037648 RepID=UPI00241D6A28|nr:helix-turn-helix domain-containing protein [Natronococcus sp. A-GB1]MDG5759794.1 helix-turn-helix domain-containing protein [Natronococcus sp. A-GB1]